MKKNKGFTLIELLAIIVILAIIAVITVPIILNIIDNAKIGSVQDSAYGYKDAINKYYLTKLAEDSNFEFNDGTYTKDQLKNMGVSISGQEPHSNSWVGISNNIITDGCIQYDEYKVEINDGKVGTAEKGICSSQVEIIYYSYNSANPDCYLENNCKTEPSGTLDETWTQYIMENTKTGKKEVCGKFSGGTVCIEPDKWEGTYSNPVDPIGGSYVQAKKTEFETKIGGNYECNINESYLECGDDNVQCEIGEDGHVWCGEYTTSGRCYLNWGNYNKDSCWWW